MVPRTAPTYDEELDQLYIGTGNGAPWNRKIRSPEGGDNLFLCSIVALDPDTGEYIRHYQTTPGETWDYNSNMDIVLADLQVDDEANEPVKAILHAPKNGFFYVINRENGKLVSAEPFVETTWASHIDIETGRPVEIPGARYETDTAYITPNAYGGHSWMAMSYNPQTGLAYFPAIHYATNYSDEGIDLEAYQAEDFTGGIGVDVLLAEMPRDYPASLIAWDPKNQRAAWEIPQQRGPNGGTLTTAGDLVFQGRADGMFVAYDARTGDELWAFNTGLGMTAAPITYELDGKQYVSMLVGWGGGAAGLGALFTSEEFSASRLGWDYGKHMRRLVTFSLDGTADMPALPPPYFPEPIEAPEFEIDPALAEPGAEEYGACNACHGDGVIAAGMAPGIPGITEAQLEAMQHFIRQRARETLQ